MEKKPKVLLTTSYGPYELGWGEDMFTARLSRGHGIFSLTSHCHYFALYLIAENLSCPTTVLEDPHWEEFEAELAEGYDYIGFQLKSLHMDKVAQMVELIKKKSPQSKIVMGGYGVSTLYDPVPGDTKGSAKYILENSDYLCREEGARFMRKVVGDEPVDRPITQYHMPLTGFSVRGLKQRYIHVPIILVSLGCPNACEFCNTSAFFHHKKIMVAQPEQTYDFMKNYARRLRSDRFLTLLFDEDMFINKDYVRELGRLIRSDKKTWNYKWFTFGSIRGLSHYDPEELRDCGLAAVWVGVESTLCDNPEAAGKDLLPKRSGDVARVIAGLHKNGIQTVASMVLGFDFHNRENIERDIDFFVGLKPTFYQIGPLTPCPGTPLYDRMKEEERLYDSYQWQDFHLWKDDVFKVANFERNEIKKYFDLTHERLVKENGPPFLTGLESFLDAYEGLSGKEGGFYDQQREWFQYMASVNHTLLKPLMKYGPSEAVKERAAKLDRRYHEEMGGIRPLGKVLDVLADWRMSKSAREPQAPVVSDPPARWTYYHREPGKDTIFIKKGHGATQVKKRNERVMALVG
jgi:radical SAM superfamily enzyme YgiQ (UPF0313 family)